MPFLAKEQSRGAPVPLRFQTSHNCPIPVCQARGMGWASLRGYPAASSSSGRAVLAFHGASERPGRAGRAWRAGCDVNPGGGSVGPSAPIPGLAHAPVTARTINTLFSAPRRLSPKLAGSRGRSIPAPCGQAPPAPRAGGTAGPDVPSAGELSCSACCWLEHPDTSSPGRVMHVHPQHLGTSYQGSPVGQAWDNWDARGAPDSKTWGGCLQQQGFSYSGGDFPREQRIALKQGAGVGSRPFPACFLGMGRGWMDD